MKGVMAMARPRIEPFWEEAIRAATENEPRLGPLGVRARLEKAAADIGKPDLRVPSLRTIGRIQREFRQRPEEERRPYRDLYWPESFERGDLPWEASAAALELLRVWEKWPPHILEMILPVPEERALFGYNFGDRPSVRLARWFWRLTQAAPDADAKDRRSVAEFLEAAEVVGSEPVERAVEAFLQYAPWRSAEAATAYQTALADNKAIPIGLTWKSGEEEASS
jgi:hypothetical protein